MQEMKRITFHFYRHRDCTAEDGKTLDLGKVASQQPVESIRARPEAVFRMHLNHLGFLISRRYPRLEGKILDVELQFRGNDRHPKVPVLTALHKGGRSQHDGSSA